MFRRCHVMRHLCLRLADRHRTESVGLGGVLQTCTYLSSVLPRINVEFLRFFFEMRNRVLEGGKNNVNIGREKGRPQVFRRAKGEADWYIGNGIEISRIEFPFLDNKHTRWLNDFKLSSPSLCPLSADSLVEMFKYLVLTLRCAHNSGWVDNFLKGIAARRAESELHLFGFRSLWYSKEGKKEAWKERKSVLFYISSFDLAK